MLLEEESVILQSNHSGQNSENNLENLRDNLRASSPEVPDKPEEHSDALGEANDSNPLSPAGDSTLPYRSGTGSASLSDAQLELSMSSLAGAQLPAHHEVGSIIDRKYELLALLGTGGMSAVYKARHSFMRNTVAVKLMHPRLLTDTQSLKRFQQEARAASRLKHPNAISVYEFGIAGGQPYLVMDYLEGISFADLIKREGKVDAERCLHIFIQACDALADAHERGIVHRDLKPSNIMLTKDKDQDNFVKVVDFGIAKIVSEGSESLKLTSTGEVFGSPLYMSPEQCMGHTLDARSDIYSMGCLMYEALTGKTPFVGKNVLETILKQTSEPAPELGAIEGDVRVVQKLDAIVLKCLAKAPEQRYQSMKELKAELEAAAQSAGSGSESLAKIGRKASEFERILTRGMRVLSPRVLLSAGVIVLAIILGVMGSSYVIKFRRAIEQEHKVDTFVKSVPASERSLEWAERDAPDHIRDQRTIRSLENKLEKDGDVIRAFGEMQSETGFDYRVTFGTFYLRTGSYKKADNEFGLAQELASKLQLDKMQDTSGKVARLSFDIATSAFKQGAYEACIAHGLRSVQLFSNAPEKYYDKVAAGAIPAWELVGRAAVISGNSKMASEAFSALYALAQKNNYFAVAPERHAISFARASDFFAGAGDYVRAVTLLNYAIQGWQHSKDRLNMGIAFNKRGLIQLKLKQWELAVNDFRDSVKFLAENQGVPNTMLAKVLLNAADAYELGGEIDKAKECRKEAEDFWSMPNSRRR